MVCLIVTSFALKSEPDILDIYLVMEAPVDDGAVVTAADAACLEIGGGFPIVWCVAVDRLSLWS